MTMDDFYCELCKLTKPSGYREPHWLTLRPCQLLSLTKLSQLKSSSSLTSLPVLDFKKYSYVICLLHSISYSIFIPQIELPENRNCSSYFVYKKGIKSIHVETFCTFLIRIHSVLRTDCKFYQWSVTYQGGHLFFHLR